MHAFGQDLDRQRPGRDAAQRGRHPELVVIAAARIEADHQRGRADAVGQVLDVMRQVVAAQFLARLDDDDAARMRRLLVAQAQERGQCPEHRIAVIGAAAAIEPVAVDARRPRPVPLFPADHLRLFVEMAVEQHRIGIVTGAAGGYLDQQQRRPAGQPDDVERCAGQRGDPLARPPFEQLDGVLHIAVLFPLRIEGWRFVRDFYVLDQGRDDIVAPALIHQLPEPVRNQHEARPPISAPAS